MSENSNRRARRVGIVLVITVVAAAAVMVGGRLGNAPTTIIRGLISSEKEGLLGDPRVEAILAESALSLQFEKAGSRAMATRSDLGRFDFAFPAGGPAAERIRQGHAVTAMFRPFYTPMAIATWEPIVQVLEASGVAERGASRVTLDVAAFMALAADELRWSDLPDNLEHRVDAPVLITSTDVRTSNSAAMYLAVTSYIANGSEVVDDDDAIARVLPVVTPLFLRQGSVEYSSEAPFDNYLIQGMVDRVGKWPMVLIYEAQFVERAARGRDAIRPGMVLMYPDPTIVSRPTLVALTEEGRRLGELLSTDPRLLALATEYGYRTGDPTGFEPISTGPGLSGPEALPSLIEPPTFAVMERMIAHLELAYGGPGLQDAPD